MPIVQSRPSGQRGKSDARRHRDKQRDAIRKQLPDIISQEDIITGRKGKTIRVPIRGKVIPDFRPGRRDKNGDKGEGGGAGIGQGEGNKGDVIGSRPAPGKEGKPGGAGEEAGSDFIEAEIDIEELIEMMLEDLGLPNLEKKEVAELEIFLGYKVKGVRRSGPRPLLFKRKVKKNAIARFWSYLNGLQDETGRSELECFDALKKAEGVYSEALSILDDQEFKSESEEIEPFLIFHEDDLRYHDLEENISHESNAVIYVVLDVSSSMSVMKKYLARSMMFWFVEFLRKVYDNVKVRFVIYHSEPKFVDEHTAFHTAESGGTISYKALELIVEDISIQYPTNAWNVYVFQFSDGDDFDSERAVDGVRKLIKDVGINMFGYGEILVEQSYENFANLMESFIKAFSLNKMSTPSGLEFNVGEGGFSFIGAKIKDKSHLWPALREFLKKDRWSE